MNDMQQFDENSFFYLLDDHERSLVKEKLTRQQFSMGQYIFRESDRDERLYIVEKGSVSIIKTLGNDLHKTILVASEGTIFGEFSFIDGGERSASALASDDTVLLALDRKDFDDLNKQYPAVGTKLYNNLLCTVTQRIRKTSEAQWRTIENVIKNEKWINPDVA